MDRTNLTVGLVETLQLMVQKGKSVDAIVQGLHTATLAGVVEYGCLRFTLKNSVPPLPAAILQTPLCDTLKVINSELGVSNQSPRKTPVKDVFPRSIEFTTIADESDTLEPAWENFLHRFERAAKSVGFTTDAALNLQSALHEMATNAAIHAQAPVPALIGYQATDCTAQFAVADVGRGVFASLTSNPKYAHLTEPVDAIHKALQTGVTSRVDDDGGFGFSTIFKALAEMWGQLRFRSGNGCITMDGTGLTVDKSLRQFPPPLLGFQVCVCCRTNETVPPGLLF